MTYQAIAVKLDGTDVVLAEFDNDKDAQEYINQVYLATKAI